MIPLVQTVEDARRAIQYLDMHADSLDRWMLALKGSFVPTPVAALQLTVAPSGLWQPGTPIRWVQGATAGYGIVSNLTGTLMTFAGAGLNTALPVNAVWTGKPELVVQRTIHLPGTYGDLAGELTTNAAFKQLHFWTGPPAYLVDVALSHYADATTGVTHQPSVEAAVYTTGWAAATLAAVPVTTRPPAHPATGCDAGAYRVTRDQQIGLYATQADDGVVHAVSLTAVLTFVME